MTNFSWTYPMSPIESMKHQSMNIPEQSSKTNGSVDDLSVISTRSPPLSLNSTCISIQVLQWMGNQQLIYHNVYVNICPATLTYLSSQKVKSPDSIILEMNWLILPYNGVKRWNAKLFQSAVKTRYFNIHVEQAEIQVRVKFDLSTTLLIDIKPN